MEEGIVALMRAGKALAEMKGEGDEQIGINIINAGFEGALIVEKVMSNSDQNYGFNAASGEDQDLVAAGVIDPAKVTRTALQNSASVSALMLTTEVMICEIHEEKSAPMPGGGHGPEMDY